MKYKRQIDGWMIIPRKDRQTDDGIKGEIDLQTDFNQMIMITKL